MKRFLPLLALSALGCGSSAPPPAVEPEPMREPSRREEPVDDGVSIEGLLGTLSAQEIDRGMRSVVPRLERCLLTRVAESELVAGRAEIAFRVATSGEVRWVFLRSSSFADSEAEACMLNVARAARFPEPHGGEAEFVFPLELPYSEDVRPPLAWEASRVANVIPAVRAEAATACGQWWSAAPFQVTVLIDRGGVVRHAGAAGDVRTPDTVDAYRCVADVAEHHTFPDPGSYPAKVSFELR